MIRRRMLGLALELTDGVNGLSSVTMARLTFSCKAGMCPRDEVKKVGGEAGGPHRPRPFRRRGAYSTGRVARGSELWTRSPESVAAGATNAVDALHLLGFDPIQSDQNLISFEHGPFGKPV